MGAPYKHPLACPWAVYFEHGAKAVPRGQRHRNWIDTLTRLPAVDTVEDFWAQWRMLPKPTELGAGTSIYVFRSAAESQQPCWENFPDGGKWQVALAGGAVDAAFEALVLALLGEQLSELRDEICGGVCQTGPIHGPFKLTLWTRGACSGDEQLRIAKQLAELLALAENEQLSYSEHRRPKAAEPKHCYLPGSLHAGGRESCSAALPHDD